MQMQQHKIKLVVLILMVWVMAMGVVHQNYVNLTSGETSPQLSFNHLGNSLITRFLSNDSAINKDVLRGKRFLIELFEPGGELSQTIGDIKENILSP
ncbi:MAG: hypothetical protein ACM3MK_03235 [Chitinophagales bacterium]